MSQHGKQHEQMAPLEVHDLTVSTTTFEFETVQPTIVFKILSEMAKKNKASGPYGIPHQLLEMITPYLTEPLTHLINQCLRQGEYPDVFKMAAVTPIPKIAAATLSDHFRPISLIANLSKVFERIVQSQLVSHLKTNSLLSSRP